MGVIQACRSLHSKLQIIPAIPGLLLRRTHGVFCLPPDRDCNRCSTLSIFVAAQSEVDRAILLEQVVELRLY